MEIFYEDILETFLFCFIASMGIIQIMVGIRGWHGLSIYGGRVHAGVNWAVGIALLAFGYAWYFSDPLHRNVRNIEAFMSLVCLITGIIAAGVVTFVMASLSEALRRRFGRGINREARSGEQTLIRVDLTHGTAFLTPAWSAAGENLVVLAEPGGGSSRLLRHLFSAIPSGRGMISLQLQSGGERESPREAADLILQLIGQLEQRLEISLLGETFLGLGWGASSILHLRPELEDKYHPRNILTVAPPVPDCERGLIGDAFLSNTPLDIAAVLAQEKPWRKARSARILRLWLPVLAACVVLTTAVTIAFDVRWKFLSGPAVGLILSLWIAYFIASRRGTTGMGDGPERKAISRICTFPYTQPESPLTVVTVSGDSQYISTLPDGARVFYQTARLEFWEEVLRGKFLLSAGTIPRLLSLIWEGQAGEHADEA